MCRAKRGLGGGHVILCGAVSENRSQERNPRLVVENGWAAAVMMYWLRRHGMTRRDDDGASGLETQTVVSEGRSIRDPPTSFEGTSAVIIRGQ